MARPKHDLKSRRIHRLLDEVYRDMFRLEAGLPGAEMGLALALLRSWIASDAPIYEVENWTWLKSICPICLNMIEESLEGNRIAMGCLPIGRGRKQG